MANWQLLVYHQLWLATWEGFETCVIEAVGMLKPQANVQQCFQALSVTDIELNGVINMSNCLHHSYD